MDGEGQIVLESSTEMTKYFGDFRGNKKEGNGQQESKGVKNSEEMVGIEDKNKTHIDEISLEQI